MLGYTYSWWLFNYTCSFILKVTNIQESADDILADAKEINEQRVQDAKAEIIEDSAAEPETAAAEGDSTEA